MAIAFVNRSTGQSLNGEDLTLTLPSGMSPGDVCIIEHGVNNQNVAWNYTETSGTWTRLGQAFVDDTNWGNSAIWLKVMGDPVDSSVTFDGNGIFNSGATAVCHAYSGVDTTTPLDVAVSGPNVEYNSYDILSPAITPVTDGCMLLATGNQRRSLPAPTVDNGYSNIGHMEGTRNNSATTSCIAEKLQATAAVDGVTIFDFGLTTSAYGSIGWKIALRPAGGPPPGDEVGFLWANQ